MPLRCCPFTHTTVNNVSSKETFVGNKTNFSLADLLIVYSCFAWVGVTAMCLVFSGRGHYHEWTTYCKGGKNWSRPLSRRLQLHGQPFYLVWCIWAEDAAVMRVIFHLIWEFHTWFGAERLLKRCNVHLASRSKTCEPCTSSFTQTARTKKLPYSVTLRCLTFRIHNSFLPWWMKTSVSLPGFVICPHELFDQFDVNITSKITALLKPLIC